LAVFLEDGEVLDAKFPSLVPVELWWFDLDQVDDRVDYFAQSLAGPEQGRAQRFALKRDRSRYIVGRYAMRCILAQRLRANPKDLALGLGAHNKPVLLDETRLSFNLSHTGALAVLALVDQASDEFGPPQVGVDIEVSKPLLDAQSMYKHCLCERELQCFHDLDCDEQRNMFFDIWVRKEACLKALGLGFDVEPHSFDAGQDAVRIADRPTTKVVQLHHLESSLRALFLQPFGESSDSVSQGLIAQTSLHGALCLVNATALPSSRRFEFEAG
jgi:4'-phosphopantetheinyl transferase